MSSTANLYIAIRATDMASMVLRDLGRAMKSASGSTSAFAKHWKSLSGIDKTIAGIGVAMTGVGIIGATFLIGATEQAIQYQLSLAKLNRVLDASPAKLATLGTYFMSLSGTTQFSAMEISDAAAILAQRGVTDTGRLEDALKNASNLAAATGEDMTTSADQIGAVTNMFPALGANYTNVANIMVAAMDSGAQSLTNLMMGLKQIGPTANALHIPFQDISAALATMIKNGANASTAGTALYQVLSHTNPVTKASIAWFVKLGLVQVTTKGAVIDGTNAFYDQHGKMKSLVQIAEILRTKLGGLTDQQREQAVAAMFTMRSSKSLNQFYEAGATSIENVTKAMGKQRTAQQKADTINATAAGQLKIMQTNWQNVNIIIGTQFLPILMKLIPIIDKLLLWFLNMSPQQQANIAKWMGLITALLLIAGPLTAVIGFLGVVGNLFAFLGPVLLGIIVAFGWWLIPMALVALLIALIITHWKEFTKVLGIVLGAIGGFFLSIFKDAANLLGDLAGLFKTIFTAIMQNMWGNGTALLGIFTTIWGGVTKGWNALWTGLTNNAKVLIKNLLGIFAPLLNTFSNVGNFLGKAGGLVGGGLQSLLPHFAEGGIVSSPMTAVVGDGGPEAIVPLSKLGKLGGGGPVHLHLYLDGKQLTESIDYHINKGNRLQGGERVWPSR